MRYAYLVVEGPHDVELVGRLLKPHGFKRENLVARLDPYWQPLVPSKFPFGGDLSRRVPVPTFFIAQAVSVAVHAAGGDSEIANRVEESLALSRPPDALGVLLDADSTHSPSDRFMAVRDALQDKKLGFALPTRAGEVVTTHPHCGIFVLPDNVTAGTLEDLLLECAQVHFPALLADVQMLVGKVQAGAYALAAEELKDFNKPAGPRKATVACIAGVLKPGKAIQVSIQDNRWLDGAALTRPRISAVLLFLKELLGLP
ncbi:DUF3226 domain-containing protein [Pyxidicoccus xibeiensis]|uniref:DUF3226 domain-containing protein n=1 Tax=Pyxidicoccus xibeiensis TaxID=2906759 RepID=UPI0020A76923|nr:DUF3226 domain-containing protein [Pyxidicoccus xibeiensis]MCP3143846.1 hypothetical protein [Pyxidicoccus xibeiensis]